MRNLKKVLALVLALVMAMSLVTIANASDFADADDITYDEAVDVLTALGVIEGVGNNTFNPSGNVTRAQMAKMITIVALGNVEPSAFLGTTTDLTDIDGHWAEAYIKYCYSQGIISGKGNGIFDPNANVTTAEASKMLLVAMGYNSDVQRYTGAQWAINVSRDAQTSKFYEDLSVPSAQALTRDQAAQLIYNAIQAPMIEKTSTVDRVTGNISDHYAPYEDNRTLLTDTFGAKTFVGTFTGNSDTGISSVKGEMQVVGRLTTQSSGSYTANFPYDFDLANIGEEVKVIFKDGTGSTANQPDKKDTIYGVFNTGATTVYHTTKADIQDIDTANDKIKFGDVKYDYVENAGVVMTNYDDRNDAAFTEANIAGLEVQSGDTIKFVCNSDGKIASAYVTASVMTKVNAVSTTKVTLNGLGSLEIDKNDIYDGAAKDDVVVYTVLYDDTAELNDTARVVVEKAEVVSGKINDYNDADAGKHTVTIDGTTYKINLGALSNLTDDAITTLTTDEIGVTVNAYLVNGMVKALQKTDDTVLNYAVVLDSSNNVTGGITVGKVQILKADGTKAIYEVDEDSDIQANALTTGDLIKYSLTGGELLNVKAANDFSNSNNNKVTIAANGTVWNYDTKTVAPGSTALGTGTAGVASAECVLFAKVSGTARDYKAYKIRDLKTTTHVAGGTMTLAKDSQGKVEAAVYDLGSTPNGAQTSTLYGMVTARNGIFEIDDTNYAKFTIWTGEETTVYIKNAAANALTVGQLYSFEQTVDDKYGAVGDFTALNANGTTIFDAAVNEYSEADQTLSVFGSVTGSAATGYTGSASTAYAIDDDAKIVYVDAANDKAGEEIGINEFNGVTGYANVKIVLNNTTDKVIVAILVESSGDANINGVTGAAGVAAAAITGSNGAAINTALASSNSVVVNGAVNMSDADVTVGADQTLIINGNVTDATKDLKVAGTLVINGSVAPDVDVTAATGVVTISGDVTKILANAGSITVNANEDISDDGDVGTITANSGTIKVAGDVTTVTANAGTITVAGTITTVADNHGTINGNVTTLTDVTSFTGTATFNGTVGTVTDVSASTGTVVFKGAVAALTDISSGNVTFEDDVTVTAGSGVTITGGTVLLKGTANLSVAASTYAVNFDAATITGEDGAEINVTTAAGGSASFKTGTLFDNVTAADDVAASTTVKFVHNGTNFQKQA